MRWHGVPVPGARRNDLSADPAQHQFQRGFELVRGGIEVRFQRRDGLAGHVRGRNEVLADLLGQRLDERRDEFHALPGDQPAERGVVELVQEQHRHLCGDAVGWIWRRTGRDWMELVAQRQLEALVQQGLGIGRIVQGRGVLADQQGLVEVEQRGILLPCVLPPLVEVPLRDDLRADPGVVELEQCLVVHQDVAAPHPGLELLDFVQQRAVAVEELVVGLPVAFYQGMADEELAAELRIHLAVVDPPARDDGHAVKRDLFVGHHRAHLLGPVRLAVAALDQVGGHLFGPERIELRRDAGPEPARLHEFGGHHERG